MFLPRQSPPTTDFVDALERGDLAALAKVPKADLHNHGTLGGRLEDVQRLSGRTLTPPPAALDGILHLQRWSAENVHPLYQEVAGIEALLASAFLQAQRDGVVRLEMSVDVSLVPRFPGGGRGLVESLQRVQAAIAPEIDFAPELGMKRQHDPAQLETWLAELIELDYFRSVDLYGEEHARPVGAFRGIFERAARAGLALKAHAGEFGTAEQVQEAVEALGLSAVQHGIAAATSPQVMRFLADHRVALNVCPTSNVVMGVVARLEEHPLRALYEAGVTVTVNTDDVLLFGRSVSEEFLALYRAGALDAVALDAVRSNGLGPRACGADQIPDIRSGGRTGRRFLAGGGWE